MTDDEKKSLLALMIGDVEGSPYYPLFTSTQYGQFLMMANGNVNNAVQSAAISASMVIGSDYTREVIGDLQLSRNAGANYLKALDYLIKNSKATIPAKLMPWIGGTGKNKLLDYARCDCEEYAQVRMAPEYEEAYIALKNDLKSTEVDVMGNKSDISTLNAGQVAQQVEIEAIAGRVSIAEAEIDALQGEVGVVNTTLVAQDGTNSNVQYSLTSLSNSQVSTEVEVKTVQEHIRYLEVGGLYDENS